MQEGFVPYLDLFDHKGIILYWIQYIGLFINPERFYALGVWLLEICNMFAFVIAILRITKLISSSKIVQYGTTIIVPVFFGMSVYEGGNLTEEYALPWITFSFYIILKYFLTEKYKWKDIYFLGIAFVIVFFLRQNMISLWVVFLPIIVIQMIVQKKWKDMRNCIFCFLLGCGSIGGGILYYFFQTGCWNEMLNYYFTFNFSYSGNGRTISSYFEAMWHLMFKIKLLVPIIVLTFKVCYKKRAYLLNLLYFFVTLCLAAMSGRSFGHYAMVLLPVTILFLVYLIGLIAKRAKNLYYNNSTFCRKLAIIRWGGIVLTLSFLWIMWLFPFSITSKNQSLSDISKYILQNTMLEDDVLILGNMCTEYLVTNRYSKNKFFYQIPPTNIDDALYEEFLYELELNHSKIIVVPSSDKSRDLQEKTNMGEIYSYLNQLEFNGIYTCEEFENFYVYKIR